MSFEAGERVRPPDESFGVAVDFCQELQLAPVFRSVGRNIQTWSCELFSGEKAISSGRGKGIGQQSRTSALCEALEHYFYEGDDRSMDEYREIDLAGKDALLADGSPDFHLILNGRSAAFSRIPFQGMSVEGGVLYLPAFLQNPSYVSDRIDENAVISKLGLLRYASNNGTASGSTLNEAALHAILEIIERDAIGIEMLRVCFSKRAAPVRRVCLESLPSNISLISNLAQDEVSGELRLWNISTDTGVPVILAELNCSKRSYFGSGAELHAAYAVERAILEAVQSYHYYEMLGGPRPLLGHTNFVETSLYQRCYLEAGHFSYLGGSVEVGFSSLPNILEPEVASVDSGISAVVEALSNVGITPFWRTIFEGPICVVQVVAPALERFHLATQGVPVAPASRGRSFLEYIGV